MATSAKMQEMAEDYGYQLAFLKSDKELYKVFTNAVNGGWDATRFVSAVRNTKWYKTHSETWRQNQQLKYTDPASYNDKLSEQLAAIRQLSGQMGVSIGSSELNTLARDAMMFGWSSDQLQRTLAQRGKGKLSGLGTAGEVETAFRQTAYRNGVNVSDDSVRVWVQKIQSGDARIEDVQQIIRERYGATLAPGFAKELAAGQDLYDLASPYMQTMAKTLELNPGDVDLFDPTIRKAMASSNDKDGQVGSTPLWQFERDLKKDSRWLKTNGARDEIDKAARSLGQMFGQGV